MAKTWLITGVSSGFGRGLAEKLLARGDRVAALTRNTSSVAHFAEAHGDRFWSSVVDLRDPVSVRGAVDAAFAELGTIDYVVSNAGYGVFGAAEETDDRQLRDIVDVNLIGSIVLIRSALPHLRAQGGGRVLQVSSEGGQLAYPGFSLYHATKWGIEGFVESLSQEVGQFGIDFVIVEPGPARTGFGKGLNYAEQMPEYKGSSVHQLRQGIETGAWVIKGDPDRMVDAMIAVAAQDTAPKRLLLGADAFDAVKKALEGRLDVLEANKETTVSVDYTADELSRMP